MGSEGRLREYAKRRDFSRTPEPAGKKERAKAAAPAFVIQQHDASRMHYDFRLQVGDVLKSWAVPKGPSTDPRDKRLAVRTEDHPLDYADFEGAIPEGEYGAGAVIVWDAGTYRNLREERDDDGASMDESLQDGKVEVWLEGEKLQGGYVLLRTKMRGDAKNWILKKLDDDAADARRNPTRTQPESVKSGRTVENPGPVNPAWDRSRCAGWRWRRSRRHGSSWSRGPGTRGARWWRGPDTRTRR